MKKLYLFLCLLLYYSISEAQNIMYVAPGTNLFVAAGTNFSAGGLTITPSAAFIVSDATLSMHPTPINSPLNTHVLRVYRFSNTTAPFEGTIHFNYAEDELNGLNESQLQVNLQDGNRWSYISSAWNDPVNNIILTNAIPATALKEITLANSMAPLPITWGTASANRVSSQVKVNWTTIQESNLSHFSIERSTDGRNWTVIAGQIAASNSSSLKQYEYTDIDFSSFRLYYRIKQTDKAGRFGYSAVLPVAAINEHKGIQVYPNPASNGFYITSIATSSIKAVQLFNNSGAAVKNWTSAQPVYDLNNLPTGIYHLRVLLHDESSQYFKINKQ